MEKVNLQIAVRNAMRLRMIQNKIITEQQIQLPNTSFEKPQSGVWLRESIAEGSEEPFSNSAGHLFAVVTYEVFSRTAYGTDEADAMVEAICRIFPVIGGSSVVYNEKGQYACIKSIDKPAGGVDSEDSGWYRRIVAVTIEMYNP